MNFSYKLKEAHVGRATTILSNY